MPRDGTGTFVRTNGTFSGADTWDQQATSADPTINSGRHDTHDQDIADAMTGSVPRDGQAGMAADLPMGGFKGTNVGDATLRNQWLTLGQRQDGDGVWCGTAGGTADALTITPVTVAIDGYKAGMALRFTVDVDNTGAVSVNVSGFGARDLKDLFGNPLVAGSLKAGMTIEILDTGTEFRFNGERKIITAQGDLITGDPNGDPTALTLGPTGQVPTSNGTKLVYEEPALPRGYIDGLILSNNATDAANDIDIATGVTRDAANADNLEVASAIGKQIDTTWAAGGTPGAPTGGLSSSLTPVQNDTWYHVILGKVFGTLEVGFDTSPTGANLVTDHSFTNTRLIGSVKRLTAANRLFTQVGDYIEYTDPSHDLNIVDGGNATKTNFTVETPTGRTVEIWGQAVMLDTITKEAIFFGMNQANRGPSLTDADLVVSTDVLAQTTGIKRLASNSTLAYRLNTATVDDLHFYTHGYKDLRGGDG